MSYSSKVVLSIGGVDKLESAYPPNVEFEGNPNFAFGQAIKSIAHAAVSGSISIYDCKVLDDGKEIEWGLLWQAWVDALVEREQCGAGGVLDSVPMDPTELPRCLIGETPRLQGFTLKAYDGRWKVVRATTLDGSIQLTLEPVKE